MIRTLLAIDWLNLKRDYVALGLTFVLPIVFFSIFAMIFGGMGGSVGEAAMTILAVDEDHTRVSGRLIEALDDQDALHVLTAPPASDDDPHPAPFTREAAVRRVRLGDYPAAVIVPAGFGAHFGDFGGDRPAVELVHDPSNPLAQHTVAGLLQAASMMAAPDVLMEKGIGQLETWGGALTPEQRKAVDEFLPMLRGEKKGKSDEATKGRSDEGADSGEDGDGAGKGGIAGFGGLVEVKAVSAREAAAQGKSGGAGPGGAADEGGGPQRPGSIISYYAAGIGVMFLLFSMVGASGGTLLQEEETGTLERLLDSRVSMSTLLGGRWLFFTMMGAAQLAVMFFWGAIAFHLDLFTPKHLAGFVAMTAVTAAAASAFALLLATICRSRAQLNGISTIVILIMSALGGSMVPRFAMPAFMNTTALFTFNGWALDGYLKVFWYDDPQAGLPGSLAALLPQLAMLAGLTVVFLVIARVLARRWEMA